jgi:hypothetical protein
VPDASDLDALIPVVVEDVHHRFGADNVNLAGRAPDKLAVRREVAWVNLRDFDVFFENFHSDFYRKMIKGIERTIKAMKKPATSLMTGRKL